VANNTKCDEILGMDNAICFTDYRLTLNTTRRSGPIGPAVWGVGLRPLACCWEVTCLVNVVCCQVQVFVTARALVQRILPSVCTIDCDQALQ